MIAVPYLENLKIFTLGSCTECDSRAPREILDLTRKCDERGKSADNWKQ